MVLSKKTIALLFFVLTSLFLTAQELTGIQADIRSLTQEKDPLKSEVIRKQIIRDYKLDSLKDSETIDILNGSVAIAFVMNKDYPKFNYYIGLIKNKFNQTSMLSMAANKLLDEHIDDKYACKIARETLEIYASYKDDPHAKPEDFSKEDWERFINFTKYPYYDTYAKALFVEKKYKEALQYQQMAFDGEPEDGIPSSVERYARLLELTGESERAKQFLLKIAGKGKLNKAMTAQLESFYVSEKGTNDHFDFYLDSLQNGILAALKKELKPKMLNETAPTFTLKNIHGKEVSLKDYQGKIVLLDLWATWCIPCIASFPAMQKLVEKHTDVEFLFIAVEEKGDALKKVTNFMQKNPYPFHVLLDEPVNNTSQKFKIISAYHPNGIPAKYVIDKNGILRFRSGGFDTDSQLINEIDAMISLVKDETNL